MSVEYDFYETPVPGGRKNKKRFHARVVPRATIDLDKLAKIIHERCSLSEGDVESAMRMFRNVLVERLKNGDRVKLDGIGCFELTATCPSVRSDHEIRAESIRFKSIAFRPEKELKRRLADTRFERVEYKKHSADASVEEVDLLLADYFAENAYITRSKFEHLCGFTRITASRRIKQLVEEGCLKRGGVYRSPIYEPMPGFYGVPKEEIPSSPQQLDR